MESSAVNISNEVKVTVNLVLNASISWLEKPNKNVLASYLVSCIVLGLLTLTAILFNVFLLLAIFCSSSLKKVILNQLVSYLSLTCLLDCSINAPFSVYYMKTNTWLLGPKLCAFNASCIFLITLAIAWILCYMCIERYLSLYKLCQNRKYSFFSKLSAAIVPLLVVLSSIVIPIVIGLVETTAFPSRFCCCVVINKQLYYRIIIIANFVFPITVSVVTLLLAYAKNFKGIRDINSQRIEMSYTELFFEESYLWNEWQISKFVGIILILFLILELPVIITFMKTSVVPLKYAQLNDLQHQNSTVQFSYPVAQVTPSIEKVYFWCKFIFCLAFPLVTLLFRKDIRRRISIIMSLCRIDSSIPKNNSVESPVPQQEECLDDFLVPQMWRRRRLSSVTSLKSPIIFGKSRSGSLQFMDLTTGIAKWKANYDESKRSKVEKPFFADVFDDEEELTEFACYEDLTEEELNSSELTRATSTSKDVGVQTTQKYLLAQTPNKTCYNISDATVKYMCVHDRRVGKEVSRSRNRRLSKSFTYNRNNSNYVKCKYYMTYPKMSLSSETLTEFSEASTSSDLLRVLQVKRSNRNNLTACNVIPRGTEELLDTPAECKNIVSL